MTNPMFFWYGIVGIVLLVFLIQLIQYLRNEPPRRRSHQALLDFCKERDLFYLPGDNLFDDENDDFEEL